MTPLGMITWHPLLAAPLAGLLMALLAGWALVIHRNLRSRMSRTRAWVLTVPRILVAVMLTLVLLDPSCSRTVKVSTANKILAVLDVSSSMDVRDDGRQPRIDRARNALELIRSGLPARMPVETLEFDTELLAPGRKVTPGATRNTDLGACLLALARRTDLSAHAAVILLTDGGDEAVDSIELPAAPLYVAGIGTDLGGASDLAIADVHVPATVEKDASFEIGVDVAARNAAAFAARDLARVPLALESETGGNWKKEDEKLLDLSNGWTRVAFKTACPEPGPRKYRLSLGRLPGEISPLNNTRTFSVDVRRKSLHVLFFARDLGSELKMLRGELMRDPGVTFTALFRTAGERFTVQGQRFPGDEKLEAGFPAEAEVLKLFDCLIIGSVPAGEWRDPQMAALKKYVEGGGAVVLLGDEAAFGPEGYAATPLAPLLPWEPGQARQAFLRGEFPVSLPAASLNHPIMAGVGDLLARSGSAASVESACLVGPLKAGATALMTVAVEKRTGPLVAVQRYGSGAVLALASNTLWKWARRPDDLEKAYGLLWRQAVRNLSSRSEGGQVLSLRWDKESYKPGERAAAEIRTSLGPEAQGLLMAASIEAGGQVTQVPVEPLQGQAGAFRARLLFEKRGAHRFSLVARQGDNVLESYEKTFPVGPLLGEGARLELDAAALTRLAARGGGLYAGERDLAPLIRDLTTRHLEKIVPSETSLTSGTPWFAAAFLVILVGEWITRRRMNLF